MYRGYREISFNRRSTNRAIQFKIDDRRDKTHHDDDDDHEIEANGRLKILQVTYC